jgi:hypothetical protein
VRRDLQREERALSVFSCARQHLDRMGRVGHPFAEQLDGVVGVEQ